MFLNSQILKARQRRGGKESLLERIEAAYLATFEPDPKGKLRKHVVQNAIAEAMGEVFSPRNASLVRKVMLGHGVGETKTEGFWFYRVRRKTSVAVQ